MSLHVQKFWSSLVRSTLSSLCLYSMPHSMFEERWVLNLLFPHWLKTLTTFFSCIYMNTHTHARHTHTKLTLFTFYLFLGIGTIWTLSATTNSHVIFFLIKRLFLFPFSYDNLWRTSTLIITKCINVIPRFVQCDTHALVLTAIMVAFHDNKYDS